MPLGRRIARLNKVGLNRLTRHIAPWAPGFGLVVHVGRKSGQEYRTPINIFRRGGGYTVALTYGPDSDWVRNVQAAGGCRVITRRQELNLVHPRLVHDRARTGMPPVVRTILKWTKTFDFLRLDRTQ